MEFGEPGKTLPWIHGVVSSGRFLRERLERATHLFSADLDGNCRVEELLERWRIVLGGGKRDVLERRLGWGGIDADSVSASLAIGAAGASGVLPDWAAILDRMAAGTTGFSPEDHGSLPTRADDPIPFEAALLPAVIMARRLLWDRLASVCGSQDGRFALTISPNTWSLLERALLAQLTMLASRVLDREFSRQRTFGENLLIDLGLGSSTGECRSRYLEFVSQTAQHGLKDLFAAYPVLGRLIATCIQFWVLATCDFVSRLDADHDELERIFGGGNALGSVTGINPSLSDRHGSGRTVMAVAFESGVKIVYKPKDLGLEEGFKRFLDWCNAESRLLPLKHPRMLNRGSYGWAEFIEHRPCEDRQGAERFYERAGMLLCLLYVLRATDCHHENLIAHGDQLILIDTETLLHPCDIAIDGLQDSTGNGPGAGERFLDSVMRIGLLPRWNLSPDKRVAFDISGLGSTVPQRVPHDVARWQAINTDDMHLRYVSVTFPLEKNIPMLDGQAVSPHAYRDRICEGFRKMYLFLISRKEELLAENGPLAGMKGHRVRYIFRDSQVYGSILDRALAPEYLQNGAAFGIELEHLARAYLTDREKPSAWNLLDEEIRAMERLDIPLLTADTSSCDLYADSKLVLRNCFRQPSFHDALDQIRAMDDDDLAWQSAIIAGSFDAMVANSPAVPDRRICAVESGIAGNQFALEEAFRIGEELAVRALHDPGGGSTWVGLGYMLRAERYQFRILGDNLYDGTPGVAVFFAGLYRQTGETRFRDLALSAVHGLRVRINRQGSHPRLQDDFDTLIGGAIGLGSRIYALVKVGTILGDSEVIEDARLLLAALSDETVRGDEQLDVMGGAAGAILGILSLYNAIRDPAALQAAHACGRHLVTRQEDVSGVGRAWRTLESIPLAGMSHGAAGIAYALIRLHAAAGQEEFLKAGLDGIEYERSLLDEQKGNWADLRPSDGSGKSGAQLTQWCHGAAGIGLARLGCAAAVTSAEFDREIEIAVTATLKAGFGAIDHLCCGNFGRVETLLVGAARRDRPDWRDAALSIAETSVTRARKTGGYGLFANLPGTVFHPGFFQGLSGIGYQLLRIAAPDLPSVLLWE